MVSFRFNEIPEGSSKEELNLQPEELEIEKSAVTRVTLYLNFFKKEDTLKIECLIGLTGTFQCDRSLDLFKMKWNSNYEVLFQTNIKEEREDYSGTVRRLDPSQNVIDITAELRDTILLSIPVKKLHPRYYKKGEITDFTASFGTDNKKIDPRWSELMKLKHNNSKN